MASSTAATADARQSTSELASRMRVIKRLLSIAGVFVIVGYLLLLFALSQEFWLVADTFSEDSMKMWLKLGGIGHVLVGIFIALVAIVRVLGTVPDRLGSVLE